MALKSSGLERADRHYKAGQLAEAEQIYRKILESDGQNPDALCGLGKIALRAGKLPISEQLLEAAHLAKPESAQIWLHLGELRQAQERWPEAAECYRTVLGAQPNLPALHRRLAYVQERLEKFDDAGASYQRAAEVELAGVEVIRRSPYENIYHCCTQKTASQWFRALFNEPAFYAYTGLIARPYVELGLRHASLDAALPAGTIGTHLYVGYATYAALPKPDAHKTFFVLRDPRDAIVSFYFSGKYSHTPNNQILVLRKELNRLGAVDGFKYMIDWLEDAGYFDAQRSWMAGSADDGRIGIFRYEDLIVDNRAFLETLFDHLDIDMPEDSLKDLCDRNAFETYAQGRRPGEENIGSHYRKGIAGDWRNHFDDAISGHFRDVTGDLLDVLEYSG